MRNGVLLVCASLCVVELQSQVIPVLVIRWHHCLDGTGHAASPRIAGVDHTILTTANLTPQLWHTYGTEQQTTDARHVSPSVMCAHWCTYTASNRAQCKPQCVP